MRLHEIQIPDQSATIAFHENSLGRTVVDAAETELASIPVYGKIRQIDSPDRAFVSASPAFYAGVFHDMVVIDGSFGPPDRAEQSGKLPHINGL